VGAVIVGLAALLAVAAVASLMIGSKPLDPGRVWAAVVGHTPGHDAVVVLELRLPRTVLAGLVGLALGLAGALMQSLTRNPLADPGILGVSAGAGFAVIVSVALGGIGTTTGYVWFAFAGAGAASAGVYALGSAGRAGATPVRLALAGVAVSAALSSLSETVILADHEAFNEFRFWVSGNLEGRDWSVIGPITPFIVLGAAAALILAPGLNTLALGEETARALGARVALTRVGTMTALTVLTGAATAGVGPIAFVGLGVPFLARRLVGADLRVAAAACVLIGPIWLIAADIAARILVAPQEVPTGIVAALAGVPFFIAVVRRTGIAAL
jgi:iron complex transport system permease protein